MLKIFENNFCFIFRYKQFFSSVKISSFLKMTTTVLVIYQNETRVLVLKTFKREKRERGEREKRKKRSS